MKMVQHNEEPGDCYSKFYKQFNNTNLRNLLILNTDPTWLNIFNWIELYEREGIFCTLLYLAYPWTER